MLERPVRVSVAFGMVTALIGLVASSHPSLWTDEVATMNAVSKSWRQLLDLLGRVDAVHGLYYVLVKPVVDTIGINAMTLRLPSALAAGLVAALIVRLTWALAGRSVALIAGVLAAVVPALANGAVEARSPMFVAAAATAASGLLVLAQRRGRYWWFGYGAAIVATAALSLVALSIVAAHAFTIAWSAPSRRTWLAWATSVGTACLVIAPLAVLASHQSEQIAWVPPLTPTRFVGTYAVAAWFGESIIVGVLVWCAVVFAIARVGHGRPNDLVALAAPWLIVPGLCLAAVTVLVSPVFVPRYLAFCAPAAVMLAALGLGQLRRTPRFVLLAAIILSCAGVAAQQRDTFGTQDSDWKTVADRIDAIASPGDPLVFVPDGGEPRGPRRALEAYPSKFDEVRDVGGAKTASDSGDLWGAGRTLAASGRTLREAERSWGLVATIAVGGSVVRAQEIFSAEGLQADLVWSGPATLIFELTPIDDPASVSHDDDLAS